MRLVEVTYDGFVHAGAKLSAADQERLKKLNAEASTLSDSFSKKLLSANAAAGYATPTAGALAGMSDAQLAAASEAARARHLKGYLLPLQNTTQQPELASLSVRATRKAIYDNSWNRTERGDANDTRAIVSRLAQLRAERAQLLGFPNHAAWRLEGSDGEDTREPRSSSWMRSCRARRRERARRQGNSGDDRLAGGRFTLEPWNWDFYSEQVRKAKYDLNDAQVKPYFELRQRAGERRVLRGEPALWDQVSRSARIYRYINRTCACSMCSTPAASRSHLLLRLLQARQQEGGAWMDLRQSVDAAGTRPVVFNVANLASPRRARRRSSASTT